MFRSPSFPMDPCGRCEALPTMGAAVSAAARGVLDEISHTGEVTHRWRFAQMRRPVREKIFTERFRKNIAFPRIGAFGLRKSALIAARRRRTIKVEIGFRG